MSNPGRPSPFRILLIWSLLMGLTGWLVQLGFRNQCLRVQELVKRQTQEQLEQEARRIQTDFSPREHVEQFLNDLLFHAPVSASMNLENDQRLVHYLKKSLAPLEKSSPSFSWYCARFSPTCEVLQVGLTHGLARIWKFPFIIDLEGPLWVDLMGWVSRWWGTFTIHTSPSTVRFNQFGDIISLFVPSAGLWIRDDDRFSRLLFSSDQHQRYLSTSEAELLFTEIRCRYIGGGYDHSLYARSTSRDSCFRLFPGHLWWGLNHSFPTAGMGVIDSIATHQGRSGFFWFPLFPLRFLENLPWNKQEVRSSLERQASLFRHLQGGFMAFLDPNDLTLQSGLWALGKNFQRRGLETAILERGRNRPLWVSPLFKRHPELLLKQEELGRKVFPRDLVHHRFTLGGQTQIEVCIARRVPPLPPGLRTLEKVLFLLQLLWFTLGILLLGHLLRLGRFGRFSLVSILVWSCLQILLPPLLQSMLNLEAYGQERTSRLEIDARSTLEGSLRQTEEAYQLFPAFVGTLIRHQVALSGMSAIFAERERRGEKPQMLDNDPQLASLIQRMAPLGGLLQYVFIFGPNGPAATYIFGPDRTRSQGRFLNLGTFYGQMYREFLLRLNPALSKRQNSRSQQDSLKFWIQFEEVLTLITWAFPTETFLEMILSPGAFVQADFLVKQTSITQIPLFHEGYPRYYFQASCQREAMTPHFIKSLYNAPKTFEGLEIPLWPSWFSSHLQGLAPPFQVFELGRMLSGKHDFPYPQWPEIPELIFRVANQGGVGFTNRLQEHNQQLIGAMASENCEGLFLFGMLPIGQALKTLFDQRVVVRVLLFVVAVLAALLALFIGWLVVRPVRELSAAADRVTRNDYSALLPEDRLDEIGDLNLAFNHMVQGVHERQRLGRFLSESIRSVVKLEDLKTGVQSATTRQVSILFVAVSGLKLRLQQQHPGLLMSQLNRLIEETVSRITTEGGMIDKIMGEKVLAVFSDATGEQPGDGACRALRAARKISQGIAQLTDWQEERVGIGLVSGPVISGVMGTPEVRLEMTVIGDTVNLASRLCDAGMLLPGGGIVSEPETIRLLSQAWKDSSHWEPHKLPLSRVKGKVREVEVFQILG